MYHIIEWTVFYFNAFNEMKTTKGIEIFTSKKDLNLYIKCMDKKTVKTITALNGNDLNNYLIHYDLIKKNDLKSNINFLDIQYH